MRVGNNICADRRGRLNGSNCGEQVYKPVLQLFHNTTKEWQYVYIEGETEPIISTPGHKYYLPENNVRREDTRALEHASYGMNRIVDES